VERAPTGMVQVVHENDWQTDPDILYVYLLQPFIPKQRLVYVEKDIGVNLIPSPCKL
jgi:hypothetical protein